MKTPMTKLMLAAAAATMLCLGAGAANEDTDGYYMLGSVQDWRDFAALVETDPTANAKMIADIDLGDDQTRIASITEKGTVLYKGVFDGQGHTLAVAYVGGNKQVVAPFSKLDGGTVKNLHIAGSIKTAFAYCGGVVGWARSGCISNVWMSADIVSSQTGWVLSGAIVGAAGDNNNQIIDCLVAGSFSFSNSEFVGCFLGGNYDGTASIVNCLSLGTFNRGDFRGNHSNCYVKQFPASYPSGVTQPTDEELADGTTATALQAGREETVWVQGDDGPMLAIFVREKETITWLNDDGTEIDTTEVVNGTMPTHADPTKSATAPYCWMFTGWTPALEPAVSNTTYAATFQKIADLSLLTDDWTAANGDEIVGTTAAYAVTIPVGASVTVNGMTFKGASGGATPAPTFAADGASEVVKFAQAEGGKWTITAFAEMSNESRGTDVTDGQIKVFSADTLEALKSVTTPAAGATVKETKSAVKATVEVPAPSGKTSQFVKVKFGE